MRPRSSALDHLAVAEADDAVGGRDHHRVVAGQQDAGTGGGVDLAQGGQHVRRELLVEPARRLVGDEERRADDEGAGGQLDEAAVGEDAGVPVHDVRVSGVTAVVLLLGVGGVFESDEETWLVGIGGFGGFLLFLIWTLATSIVLMMRSRQRTAAMA